MIIRIVNMTFREERTGDFEKLFEERKALIRRFDGCRHLELWQDTADKRVFFTYSVWESGEHLEHYRQSELFRETWKLTKALFEEGPKAWSVLQKHVLPAN